MLDSRFVRRLGLGELSVPLAQGLCANAIIGLVNQNSVVGIGVGTRFAPFWHSFNASICPELE